MTRRHVVGICFLESFRVYLHLSGGVCVDPLMLPLSTILVSLFYGAFSGPTLVLAAAYLFALSTLLSFSGLVGSD